MNLWAVLYDCTVLIVIDTRDDLGVHTFVWKQRKSYLCYLSQVFAYPQWENPAIYLCALLVLSGFLVSNLNLLCHDLFLLLHVLSMKHKEKFIPFTSILWHSWTPIISPFGFLFLDWTALTLSISLLSTASKENKYEGFRMAQKVSSLCPVRAMIKCNFTLYISKSQGLLCLSTSFMTGSSGRQRSSSFPQEKLSS